MRDETRRRLERQLLWQRLKWVGAGLGVIALMGLAFWYTDLDASVETHKIAGVVEAVGPVTGGSSLAIEQALTVDVKLSDGRLAHVLALKTTHPVVGEHVEIAEHVHGTGRVTFTWK